MFYSNEKILLLEYPAHHTKSQPDFPFSPCRSLQCGHCQVRAQGTLPAELAHLSALVTLDLQGQLFTGGVPRAWFATDAWPTLQNLFLANNPLGGALPESQSGSLTSLIQLNLDDCDIAGPLPLSWGQDETSMRQLSVL